jgi:uncharacterized membrane protein YfcA
VSLLPALLLVPAGVVAGVLGSAGGITSLVSYPALLAVGVPPLPANVGNIVAAVALGPSSALASRDELTGRRPVLLRLLPVALAGSAAGALLLLATPPGVFARVVPFLVATGALVLLLQPTLASRGGRGELGVGALSVAVVPVSVYSGYFGAGSGVMFLAAVLFYEARVAPANAIKNVLVGITCAAAALVLVLTASVPWAAVLPLAVGLLVGGALGPRMVRRVPGRVVRWFAAALGFGLAVYLWFAGA